ncbi:MAG TPA: aminotransferase class I/II-fold pyridoxal phosphate-dependent enzyme, partial [Dehalococcoidia bacterium]|nr:aminotransferase class I/II-fold pyridoxal phosphate-dependent enzyme [Dehalococcoidia bacterium]
MSDISSLIRRDLLDMAGYEPIEPPQVLAEALGIPAERVLKLDGNENPYGSSPKALAALASLEAAHIYPDPQQRRLRSALAAYTGLGEEQLVAGSGSDELIDLIIRLFLGHDDGVITCPPTFAMYGFSARVAGAPVMAAPRRHNFSLDMKAIAACRERGGKLIFVASPNNPTGNLLSEAELEGLLDMGLIVVVDEAYGEFAGQSFADRVGAGPGARPYPSLIVLRSFSKWAGLAGLRVG